ncbi:MAG: hypothetical protein U1E28_12320 [Beijerinckiaceae bacterium]
MFDSDDDFDRALRVLRNAVGFVCCLASGALIAMAYGGWRLFAVLLLLYWPLLLAMDIGSRQNWYGRARGLLGRIRLLRAVDLVVAGLVLVGPTWIAQRFNLEIGPAALVLVLSAGWRRSGSNRPGKASASPPVSSCSNISSSRRRTASSSPHPRMRLRSHWPLARSS